jgi:hypothetical protein
MRLHAYLPLASTPVPVYFAAAEYMLCMSIEMETSVLLVTSVHGLLPVGWCGLSLLSSHQASPALSALPQPTSYQPTTREYGEHLTGPGISGLLSRDVLSSAPGRALSPVMNSGALQGPSALPLNYSTLRSYVLIHYILLGPVVGKAMPCYNCSCSYHLSKPG